MRAPLHLVKRGKPAAALSLERIRLFVIEGHIYGDRRGSSPANSEAHRHMARKSDRHLLITRIGPARSGENNRLELRCVRLCAEAAAGFSSRYYRYIANSFFRTH